MRLGEERSDEMITPSISAKITHARTSVQDAPPPQPTQELSPIIPTPFAIRFAHRRREKIERGIRDVSLDAVVTSLPYRKATSSALSRPTASSLFLPHLYQLIDPTTPTGGFSHSLTLESGICHGMVQEDGDGVKAYVKHVVRNLWGGAVVYMLAGKRWGGGGKGKGRSEKDYRSLHT